MILAVLGTDTGVGKTIGARVLLDRWRGAGFRSAAVKPFVSGAESGRWSDLDILDPESCFPPPCAFQRPLSPLGAHRLGEPAADLEAAARYVEHVCAENDRLVIEGIGGVLVPLVTGTTWADFHASFGWPALVVARPGLGTLNHSLLTIEALRQRGIPTVGVVLNGVGGPHDPAAAEENAAIIASEGRVECLGCVPYNPVDPFSAWAGAVHWERLEEILGGR